MSSSVHLAIFKPIGWLNRERKYLGAENEVFKIENIAANVTQLSAYEDMFVEHPESGYVHFYKYVDQIYGGKKSTFMRCKLVLVDLNDKNQADMARQSAESQGEKILLVRRDNLSQLVEEHFGDSLNHRERNRFMHAGGSLDEYVARRTIAYAVPLNSFVRRMKAIISREHSDYLGPLIPQVVAFLDMHPQKAHAFCVVLMGSDLQGYSGRFELSEY